MNKIILNKVSSKLIQFLATTDQMYLTQLA